MENGCVRGSVRGCVHSRQRYWLSFTDEGPFLRDGWAMENERKLMHIPDGYKATLSAIHSSKVAMDHSSGLVTIIGFNKTDDKTL